MSSVFETLNDTRHSIDARVAIAWTALHNKDIHPRSEDRVAAKCWLVHRITDGTVPSDQWPQIARVQPQYVNDDGLEVRWRISLLTAEMYLHGLRRCNLDDMRMTAEFIRSENENLHRWPPCILNYLRAMAALALCLKSPPDVASLVDESVKTWQRIMGNMDWLKHPMRMVELRDDLSALWQLIAIGRQCGCVQYKQYDWLPKFCGGTDLFSRLMRQLDAPQL